MEQVERSLAHDAGAYAPHGPYARIRTPSPTRPRAQRHPENTFDVDDSGVEPRAERTSRSRRAVNWWNRRVMRSRSLTWLALILILLGIVAVSGLATWAMLAILNQAAKAGAER